MRQIHGCHVGKLNVWGVCNGGGPTVHTEIFSKVIITLYLSICPFLQNRYMNGEKLVDSWRVAEYH